MCLKFVLLLGILCFFISIKAQCHGDHYQICNFDNYKCEKSGLGQVSESLTLKQGLGCNVTTSNGCANVFTLSTFLFTYYLEGNSYDIQITQIADDCIWKVLATSSNGTTSFYNNITAPFVYPVVNDNTIYIH
eukprot:TRINITY_DN10759_c2_g1_i1.p1 TRINITY_DN10759_c2_g1~~TRINITY_DN10759_c2_g1_i1.p1  ORF type:complete len:133 (+),score=11.52 TRINITY_DN10759_c2_g1_i1:356-754(+)